MVSNVAIGFTFLLFLMLSTGRLRLKYLAAATARSAKQRTAGRIEPPAANPVSIKPR
jgi:hypothetical protein